MKHSGRQVEFTLLIDPRDAEPVAAIMAQAPELVLHETAAEDDRESPWGGLRERSARQLDRLRGMFDLLDVVPRAGEHERWPGDAAGSLLEACDAADCELEGGASEFDDLRRKTDPLRQDIQEMEQWCCNLEMFESLSLPLGSLKSVRQLHVALGSVEPGRLQRLRLPMMVTPFVVVPLAAPAEGRQAVAAVGPIEDAPFLRKFLQTLLYSPASLPEQVEDVATTELVRLREKLEENKLSLEGLVRARRGLQDRWQPRLDELWARLQRVHRLAGLICRHARCGASCYAFSGEVGQAAADRLFAQLRQGANHHFAVTTAGAALQGRSGA